jgi:hypothetical protein
VTSGRAVLSVIPTQLAVEAAWTRFQKLAQQLRDQPGLVTDREFWERLLRAEIEWKNAFEAWVA